MSTKLVLTKNTIGGFSLRELGHGILSSSGCAQMCLIECDRFTLAEGTTDLNLRHQDITESELVLLSAFLRHNAELASLDVSNNLITGVRVDGFGEHSVVGLSTLFTALKSNDSLLALDLSDDR